MNYPEITNAVKHLRETCKCLHCESAYRKKDIHVVATTKVEGLFDLRCPSCKASTIVTVLLAPEVEIKKAQTKRTHRSISHDDILDIKNFLNHFDGDFKKIFIKE